MAIGKGSGGDSACGMARRPRGPPVEDTMPTMCRSRRGSRREGRRAGSGRPGVKRSAALLRKTSASARAAVSSITLAGLGKDCHRPARHRLHCGAAIAGCQISDHHDGVGWSRMMISMASMPPIIGISTSMVMTSGRSVRVSCSPRWPSPASPTISGRKSATTWPAAGRAPGESHR